MAESDYSLRSELSSNIVKFEKYQQQTLKIANDLYGDKNSTLLKDLISRYESIKYSLPSKAQKMCEQRIEFLKGLSFESLDMSKEMELVSFAEQMQKAYS